MLLMPDGIVGLGASGGGAGTQEASNKAVVSRVRRRFMRCVDTGAVGKESKICCVNPSVNATQSVETWKVRGVAAGHIRGAGALAGARRALILWPKPV